MKVRPGANVRIVTGMLAHYRHARYQERGATNTVPAFGASRVMHAGAAGVIHIPTATESARKVKTVKVDGRKVRRVTYR